MNQTILTVYPYIHVSLGEKGDRFDVSYQVGGWITKTVYYPEHNSLTVALPPITVEIETPEDVRPMALAALREYRTGLKAEHVATLTKLSFLENQLLGLAAPEVLNSVIESPPEKEWISPHTDDDIPF